MPRKRLPAYLALVGKLWGEQISGPVLALVGFALLVGQAYITDGPTAIKIVRWGAWITLGTALFMVFVAQFKAWSAERSEVEGLQARLSDSLPKFNVAIEQMTTGNIEASFDDCKTFQSITYIAPLVRVLNLGAASVVTGLSMRVKLPNGNVLDGRLVTPPNELVITNASGISIRIPFGEPFTERTNRAIERGTIARGRLFCVFDGRTQGDIGGAGVVYEVTIRDAWYPQTPDHVAAIEWKPADSNLQALPGMGVTAKMVQPINLALKDGEKQ